MRKRIAQRAADQVEQEEMADLLADRYFHASILCPADARGADACRGDAAHTRARE